MGWREFLAMVLAIMGIIMDTEGPFHMMLGSVKGVPSLSGVTMKATQVIATTTDEFHI
jgi:hypothetical protein